MLLRLFLITLFAAMTALGQTPQAVQPGPPIEPGRVVRVGTMAGRTL
ncbi:MAG: hypothetical protein ACKVQJ_00795 [Pyrinomonadaceae bacterium]